jgi:interleukin-1 receptor-associated kinase 1
MFPSRHRLLTVSVVLVFLLPAPGVHPQAPNIWGTKANGKYACADCSTSVVTSDRGPTFEANLLRFRDSLKGMAPGNASFLNATFAAAAGDAPEDTVYGLATCLADAEASDCVACLAAAAGELPGTRCASRRDMVLWYPQCLVRYDNASFFGVADTARWFDVPNPNDFSDPTSLYTARERLNGRMLAAAALSPLRFAFGDERVTANTTLHGLAQCTEDLTLEECNQCLKSQVARVDVCCADMDGVRINGASCYLRYEFMAIVPGTPPSMAPLVEPPPPEAPSGGAVSSSRTRRKTTICEY